MTNTTFNTTITATKLRNSLNKNIAERVAYEAEKNVASSNVVNNLFRDFSIDHKTQKTTLKDTFFQKLIDAKFIDSFDFINNAVKANNRFNTYAISKAALKLQNIVADKLHKETALNNKFCVACVLTCLQNKDKESFSFDRSHALSMLSRALKFEHVAMSDLSTKFNVTANTAETQVSSSFRVLEAFNILTFDDSVKARSVVSNVNYDNAFVKLVAAKYQIDI